ncbi:hypothetical protein [Pedobacter sp.]
MKKTTLAAFALLLFSCGQSSEEPKNVDRSSYFDISGYFGKEASRLKKANPTVSKQVIVKGEKEVKNIKITDWDTELASYVNADINKTSWRNQFSISKNDSLTIYTTNNPKIPVKKVEVHSLGNKVVGIKIFKLSENALYDAVDTLIYFADSIYIIKNEQQIKLLGKKRYEITATFK